MKRNEVAFTPPLSFTDRVILGKLWDVTELTFSLANGSNIYLFLLIREVVTIMKEMARTAPCKKKKILRVGEFYYLVIDKVRPALSTVNSFYQSSKTE